jgi:hypothetical protein
LQAGRGAQSSRPSSATGWIVRAALLASLIAPAPALAQANKVRISDLTDVSYGTILNLQSDNRRAQNICVSANAVNGLYSVTASGTGPGGALELSSGGSSLPYSVEWSSTPGQATGSDLAANTALVGQFSPEKQQDCKTRGLQTASLVVVLRGTELSKALQGSYQGNLTILIAAQ